MKLTNYSKWIPLIYGMFVALGLIVYFWIAWLLGIVNVPELRVLNLVIQTTGIYLAYRQFRRTHHDSMHYFRALSIGFATSTIGTSTFVLFLFTVFKLNPALFESIIVSNPLRPDLTVYIATFAVWSEGILSGMLGTFILTNTLKTDSVNQLK